MVHPAVEQIDMYVDAAEIDALKKFVDNPLVKGYTTNPTLMNKAGITNFISFAEEAASIVSPAPISLEVFADDDDEIYRQAHIISKIGDNVFVKIPVTNTKGESLAPLVTKLSAEGIKLNVTALLTTEQVTEISNALDPSTEAIISVFAGRIADTGCDPLLIMKEAASVVHRNQAHKLLWASPREILNLVQAVEAEADIITMTPDLWKKIEMLGKDLTQLSLETVQMFFNDASTAGFTI
ncbi:MAG: transaldolase [Actinomycetota bacterium]|nr:transaldolase [Actinomycetota bacterium]